MAKTDALITAGRLLRESWWLARDRVSRSGTSLHVPARAAAVGPQWLTHVLQPRFPGVRVRAVEPLGRDVGTTDRLRLGVTYGSAGDGEQPPASVFVKLAPADFKTRLFVNLMRLGATEVRFYREVAEQLPIEIPRMFHARIDGRAQRFALVFEDLGVRGARFMTVAEKMTLEEARRVVSALARFHARFWDSAQLSSDLAWMKAHNHNPNYRVERFISGAALGPAARRFSELVPPALRAAIPRLIAERDQLEDAWAQRPLTLIHGDAHVGNLYFLPDAVGFLDWQVVQHGQGMRDVSYFLINSVPTDLRRAHERELIGHYLSALAEHGVAAADFDAAWEQYRLHALYAWIAVAVTAAATTLQTAAIVRAGLARSSTAVMDLRSLATLAS